MTAVSEPETQEKPLPPLRSVHTTSFPAILDDLGVSVLVTTYQAGKLAMLRADEGKLNTHFRGFKKPMGLAVDGDRLAIGTALEIWEYHNAPAVGRRLPPAGRHDACFLPAPGTHHRRHPHPRNGLGHLASRAWGMGLVVKGEVSSGSSTRASPACARSMACATSCRAGARRSSTRWPPKTAATSTAWPWSTPPGLRHRPGGDRHEERLA